MNGLTTLFLNLYKVNQRAISTGLVERVWLRSLAVVSIPLLAVLLNSCNIAKHLPKDERLYMGTEIKINADSTVSGDEQDALKEQLGELARPRPNAQILGYPYKVGLYYLFGEPKKNGFRAWFRKKFGTEPVFASSRALQANVPIWENTLENEGYFGSTVSGTLREKGYKAWGNYTVQAKQRYHLDSIAFIGDSNAVRRTLKMVGRRTILKRGDPYRLDNLKLERERISQDIKKRGYYYFLPDYVAILAKNDSVKHKTDLYFAVKPEIPRAASIPYYIRDVFVYSDYTLSTAQSDTSLRRAYETDTDFIVVDSSNRFNPKLFRDLVAVRPNTQYSSLAQDLTLSRFINVGAFKFVRNRFEPAQQGDSAVLDVHYYLTPYPTKSLRFEIDGTSRSNNFNGSQVILSWRNRNALRRAELLTINANAGIEFQVNAGDQGITNYRFGLDGILSFPRLVSPIRFRSDTSRKALPKTNATLGYQTIIRGGLYRINSFQTTFGYAWRQSQQIEHVFQPFSANYVYVPVSSIGDEYYRIQEDTAVSDIVKRQYQNIVYGSDQLILSSLYQFNYNSSIKSRSPNTFRLTANVEVAGNVVNLFVNKINPAYDRKTIFGVPFAQYLRLDLDARLYRKLSSSVTWANRLFAGVGVPYGNSGEFQLPFTKQYFVGGANSVRAFRARAIGPGLFTRDTIRNVPIFQDGGGDVKLEANTEIRAKFGQYLEGAVFVDAGNVWTYNQVATFGEPLLAQFSKSFYEQIAIGAGVGVRIDLSYFLIRLDLATPLRKPYKTNGSEWVINQFDFGSKDWRKQNLIFNIAVGYPF